jgi:VanZ family protein
MISQDAWQRTRLLRLVWVAFALTIIVGSLLPGNSATMLAVGKLHISDKLEHALAYSVLALLPALHERLRNVATLLLIAAVLGVLLEFGQLYSPGRSFDISDMIADVTGIVIGTLTGLLLRPLVSRQEA